MGKKAIAPVVALAREVKMTGEVVTKGGKE